MIDDSDGMEGDEGKFFQVHAHVLKFVELAVLAHGLCNIIYLCTGDR